MCACLCMCGHIILRQDKGLLKFPILFNDTLVYLCVSIQ